MADTEKRELNDNSRSLADVAETVLQVMAERGGRPGRKPNFYRILLIENNDVTKDQLVSRLETLTPEELAEVKGSLTGQPPRKRANTKASPADGQQDGDQPSSQGEGLAFDTGATDQAGSTPSLKPTQDTFKRIPAPASRDQPGKGAADAPKGNGNGSGHQATPFTNQQPNSKSVQLALVPASGAKQVAGGSQAFAGQGPGSGKAMQPPSANGRSQPSGSNAMRQHSQGGHAPRISGDGSLKPSLSDGLSAKQMPLQAANITLAITNLKTNMMRTRMIHDALVKFIQTGDPAARQQLAFFFEGCSSNSLGYHMETNPSSVANCLMALELMLADNLGIPSAFVPQSLMAQPPSRKGSMPGGSKAMAAVTPPTGGSGSAGHGGQGLFKTPPGTK